MPATLLTLSTEIDEIIIRYATEGGSAASPPKGQIWVFVKRGSSYRKKAFTETEFHTGCLEDILPDNNLRDWSMEEPYA